MANISVKLDKKKLYFIVTNTIKCQIIPASGLKVIHEVEKLIRKGVHEDDIYVFPESIGYRPVTASIELVTR
jgi:hypothetical protein